ncbi:hypothetical protein RA24_16950 [Leisingera sp. ANG-M6]|nr:hypothetical protein RA24_16950 [Leisingera sp. ANG-M6]
MRSLFRVSERRACRVLKQHRSTQRKPPKSRADKTRLVADMIVLARQYGRYGYRRIAALLRGAGWQVNCEQACNFDPVAGKSASKDDPLTLM